MVCIWETLNVQETIDKSVTKYFISVGKRSGTVPTACAWFQFQYQRGKFTRNSFVGYFRSLFRSRAGYLLNYLEGSCCGLIEVLSRHFPGGTEGNHEKLSQFSLCYSWDSNRVLTALKMSHLGGLKLASDPNTFNFICQISIPISNGI